ncbi:MAG: cardiolipin synthase B [Betaproteobacteria bacterium]|nr:cardiolipin synthase B [Betaproteobacteria bacterium]
MTAETSDSSHAQILDRLDRAYARAAGASVSDGNSVRMLLDSEENFPAWLAAINGAQRYILFESYIFANDAIGRQFIEALAEKARSGVRVHVLYDWFGSHWSRSMWRDLVAAGANVRSFNPPSFDTPLSWLTRDHRKSIVVDGRIGFVSGLCVSAKWQGDSTRRLEAWRDTGIEILGPAVHDLEHAFGQVWTAAGGAQFEIGARPYPRAGNVRLRVIAGVPNAAGTYRLDLLVASIAREHLWLTDAYFIATAAYTQALSAAARDGVDVRLLVPGASDVPAVSPLSRAGYRPLLEAGVRVFEWNGTMLHAKTAVADRRWARVGSTNLNLASWMANYELDVAIEDDQFAEVMADQYERDLANATEIILTPRNRVQRTDPKGIAAADEHPGNPRRAIAGSAGRAAAGAVSVGSALGAALTNRRKLGPAEAGLLTTMSAFTVVIALIAALWPRVLAWPIAALAIWFGVAWGIKAFSLWRARGARHRQRKAERARLGVGGPRV